jgi:hypothetical protein
MQDDRTFGFERISPVAHERLRDLEVTVVRRAPVLPRDAEERPDAEEKSGADQSDERGRAEGLPRRAGQDGVQSAEQRLA